MTPPPDTTAPKVTIATVSASGSTASFTLTADEAGVTFQCQLTLQHRVIQAWTSCGPTVTYSNLKPGTYVLSVRGTDAAGNQSSVVTTTWKASKVTAKAPQR